MNFHSLFAHSCSIIKLNCWEFIFIFKMKLEFVVAQAPNAKTEKSFVKLAKLATRSFIPRTDSCLGSIKRAL